MSHVDDNVAADKADKDVSVESVPTISDIMTKDVITVTLQKTVKSIIAILHEKNITGIPVVDDANKVIGVISSLDIIIAAGMGKLDLKISQLPIKLSAEKDILKIRPTAPIKEALILIVKYKVGRVIVIDDTEGLVGIVTRKNLIGFFANM